MVTAVACAQVRKSPSSSAAPTAPAITACAAALTARASVHLAERAHLGDGGEQAASVLATVRRDNIEAAGKTWSEIEEEEFKQPIRDQYEAEGNPITPPRGYGTTHHHAGGDAPRAGTMFLRGAERADTGDEIRVFRM